MESQPVVEQPLDYPPASANTPYPQNKSDARALGSYVVAVLVLLFAGAAFYAFWPRSGTLQISVKPPNARVAIDGTPLVGLSPFVIERRAGVYRLLVSSPGYTTVGRRFQISAHQQGHLDLALKPSPDTGIDLTSTPTDLPVWLDGRPLSVTKDGKQARTSLHALTLAPGRHVIEVRGGPLYQPWRREFVQQPGQMLGLHANLVPLPSNPAAQGRSSTTHSKARSGRQANTRRSARSRSYRPLPSESTPRAPQVEDPFENGTWRR